MFCAYCGELMKGKSYIYEDEQYCSRECFLAVHDDIDGSIDKYEDDWQEELEEDY